MGIKERIAEIEAEMKRTQRNKNTEYHIGRLKAQLAKLRRQMLDPASKILNKKIIEFTSTIRKLYFFKDILNLK